MEKENNGMSKETEISAQNGSSFFTRYLMVMGIIFIAVSAVVRNSGNPNEEISPPDNEITYSDETYDPSHSGEYSGAPKIWSNEDIGEYISMMAKNNSSYGKIYQYLDDYPHDLLQALCNNPEMLDFTAGYFSSGGSQPTLTEEELEEDVPLFIQWDERWGYEFYGDDIIGLSGCGPACLSMAVVSMTGNENATPKEVADFSMRNGYYEFGSGTTWLLMTEGCMNYGLEAEELPLMKNEIFQRLENGELIICSVSPGDFTAFGHFILLCGIEDGKIRLQDPNSIERSQKLWSFEELEPQIRNLWSYTCAERW